MPTNSALAAIIAADRAEHAHIKPVRSPAVKKLLALVRASFRRNGLKPAAVSEASGSTDMFGYLSAGHDSDEMALGSISVEVTLEAADGPNDSTCLAICLCEMKVTSRKDGKWNGSDGISFKTVTGSLDAVLATWQEVKASLEAACDNKDTFFHYSSHQ